ncbi:MAG: hypothetical protein GU359_00590 [Desulfurococcales archaeon]|jgi:hypothetical protein|nr:hypothetical protein [Desulfurococcales archaeon]
MISKDHLSNTLLIIMITLTTWAFWSIGEHRLDVYISMFVLEYLIIKMMLRPRRIFIDILQIGLLIIFLIFVSIRIYEVLIK